MLTIGQTISSEAIEELIAQRVVDALLTYEANRNNINENVNGNGSHDIGSGSRRTVHTAHGCTYKEFLSYQPHNFKGFEGAVGLARWFRKKESVFHINNYVVECQGTNVAGYTQRFQELALLCPKMVPNEEEKIKRQAENKSRLESNPRNNHVQQPPFKRQNVARAYTVGPGEKKSILEPYLCVTNTNFTIPVRALQSAKIASGTNRGNAARSGETWGMVYALGRGEAIQDLNVVTGTFLLNNHYASILFDTGADRSFVSTAFSSLIDIASSAVDTKYDVELADGKIVGVDTIIQGCTLNLLDHSFNINLMPIELGSFDVIIDMNWLSKYHGVIVCDEKIVRIPYGDEILIVRGDRSDGRSESRLNIISFTKTQKYLQKWCHVFLAHVTKKKTKDKSKDRRLEDVPTVRDFSEVFPKDLHGLPPTQQVEF
ncbi:putative reverse transcriptase domain-containing protein [Tanacetum coccineum]